MHRKEFEVPCKRVPVSSNGFRETDVKFIEWVRD